MKEEIETFKVGEVDTMKDTMCIMFEQFHTFMLFLS